MLRASDFRTKWGNNSSFYISNLFQVQIVDKKCGLLMGVFWLFSYIAMFERP